MLEPANAIDDGGFSGTSRGRSVFHVGANVWRVAWLALLCCAVWPMVFGAVYGARIETSKPLAWYFLWPPLLLFMSHIVSWFNFHVYRQDGATAFSFTSSAVGEPDPDRMFYNFQALALFGSAFAGSALALLFSGLEYWNAPLRPDGSEVDTWPAMGVLCTVAMLLLALACRLFEIADTDLRALHEQA